MARAFAGTCIALLFYLSAGNPLAAVRRGRYSEPTTHVRSSGHDLFDARVFRGGAKEQVDFGIRVAQNGLWREAQYRWERAVELDPTYAEAWNNLAIAYEHSGKFDDARKAYETALKLDPKNMVIRQNYDLFKEINDRTQKRRGGR